MKRIFFSLVMLLAMQTAGAIYLPTGAKQLYYGAERYESYGMYYHTFTIYEHQGKTYLVRTQSFSGALAVIVSKEDLARDARYVKVPLTAEQVKKIQQAIIDARFIEKIAAYDQEESQYKEAVRLQEEKEKEASKVVLDDGRVIYREIQKRNDMHYHQPTMWDVKADWAGVGTGIKSYGEFYNNEKAPDTWTGNGRPARKEVMAAVHSVNSLLSSMAYDYKYRHPEENELTDYCYTTSGGMQMLMRDGKKVRQGTKICFEFDKGIWRVTGYVNEQEDTVIVGDDVVRKMEKMTKNLNLYPLTSDYAKGKAHLKSEVSDGVSWHLAMFYFTQEGHNYYGTIGEGYLEPKSMAKAYKRALADMEKVNKYLWSLLHLPQP